MNRKQRRSTDNMNHLEMVAACPDCDSETSVVEIAQGVYRGVVAHDDTCPWWTALRASGGGVRFTDWPT